MNKSSDNLNHLQTNKKRIEDAVKNLQPRNYHDEDFLHEFKFSIDEIHTIKKTYEKYAYKQDLMNKRMFCNSLGILAMDNAHFLADRLFDLMDTDRDGVVRFIDFIRYLDAITNRDLYKKAEMSFKFIDRDNKEMIVYEDIEYLIHKVALFWKDLTGQTVVPQRQHIDEIFSALDSREIGEVRLSDFQKMYYNQDCYFQWFEFFNQDETIQIHTNDTKLENEEQIKQKYQLLRMEIETKLKDVEQEISDLIVTLNKVSTKYKELKEVDDKQIQLMFQKKQQQVIQNKLQSHQNKNGNFLIGSSKQVLNQMNINLKNSQILYQKNQNGQYYVDTVNNNYKDDLRTKQVNSKNNYTKKNSNQNFELVLNPAQNQTNTGLQHQNQKQEDKIKQSYENQKYRQQTSQENIKQILNKNQVDNPIEFASSSSSSSVAQAIKKNPQKQIVETISQINNMKYNPSIDFSPISTQNTHQIGYNKQQLSSSQKKNSIFYQQEPTQQNKPKYNIFQQNDFLQDLKKNSNEQNQNKNNNSLGQIPIRNQGNQLDFLTMPTFDTNQTEYNKQQLFSSYQMRASIFYQQESSQLNKSKQNIFQQNDFLQDLKKNQNEQISQNKNNMSLGQIPIKNNGNQFDQSAYYGINNFFNNKIEQRKPQELINKSQNSFICGGFQDTLQKKPTFESYNSFEEEEKKLKRRYKIFDSSPVSGSIPQVEDIKNLEKKQQINLQEKLNQKYKTFSSSTSSNNMIKNQKHQDTNKISQQNNQQHEYQKKKSPLYMQVLAKHTNNGQNLSPAENISKTKFSSLSQHFGSISEISQISADAYSQPPVLNDVNGPVKINLPTEQNFGDNDPETEDETDINNNRSYLEQKFQLLQNQSNINTNSSPKHFKQKNEPNISPSSIKSSKTDVLYNSQQNKKQNIEENNNNKQNKIDKKSIIVEKNKFKVDSEQDLDSQFENKNSQRQDGNLIKQEQKETDTEKNEEQFGITKDQILSQGKAVDYLCQEYNKVEKKIQEYVDLISQYQSQLKELDEMYINSIKEEEFKNLYKKNGVLNIKQFIPTIIDEESILPTYTSNQQLGNISQRRFSLNQFNMQSNSQINQLVKKSLPYNSNYNSNDNNIGNMRNLGITTAPSNIIGSSHNIVHKKSVGYNEISQENLIQSNRRSTIKNMPDVLKDKENKSSTNKNRNLQLYIGHENWNLILEMMLVIRSAIKSLKKINHPALNHGYLGSGMCASVNTESNQLSYNLCNQNQNQQINSNSIFYQNQNNFQNSQVINQNQNQSQFNTNFSNHINFQRQNSQNIDSSFAHLDSQFNNQIGSIILGEKKTQNKVTTGVFDGSSGLPIEIKTKDFEHHNQQLLFTSFTNSNYQFATCEYIDFCPLVFESLRRFQNISQETFLRSLGPENLIGNLIMGRMDQISELCRSTNEPNKKFQYYSECGQFIIKTIPEVNAQYFLKIMPHYYQYMLTQPNTLILRIYGLYKLQLRQDKSHKRNSENQQEIQNKLNISGTIGNQDTYAVNQLQKMNSVYFMVCQNVFNTNLEIKQRFEIKGSTRGRKAFKKNIPQPNQTIPKKDLDWIDSHMRIKIDIQLRQQMLNQLSLDVQFLKTNRLLNYCALIGVKDFQKQSDLQQYFNQDIHQSIDLKEVANNSDISVKPFKQESRFSRILSKDKKSIYFIGLINIFTEYTTSKKWIAMIKNPFLGKTQSTVDPQTYSARLIEFFDQFILD